MTAMVNHAVQSILDAAHQIGYDDVLADPTDDAIVLAAAELAYGRWPINGIPEALIEPIVIAWTNGQTAGETARIFRRF